MLPNELVDKVLDQTDIVEVISSRIPLKKTGRNFKANCPFHSEKTPSFVVSPDKQIFHCFGCGEGGNAVSFLMKYEKLDFREVMKLLADKAGIKLPDLRPADGERSSGIGDKLFAVNEAAKNFYKAYLYSAEGKMFHRYLKERGLTDDVIKVFQLGSAPNMWDGLISHFSKKNTGIDLLEKAGLVLAREQGKGHYDRFRNRCVFPIFDIRQKVIGFGARGLDPNAQPKYINSPETPIYNKGRNLYGLNFSKGYIKEQDYAVIVEGYFDLIVPFQYGVKNIVATLGTALTPDQVKLLKRFSQTAVVVFDSDKAGEEASLRGLDLLVSMDMNVRIATLPKGSDPDSYVRKNGKDAFLGIVKASKDLFDYKMALLMAKFNKEGVRGRAAIATLMLPTIARIPNEILKAAFLKKLSGMLSIDEAALRAELKKVKKDYSYTVDWDESGKGKKRKVNTAELMLLSIVLENPDDLKAIEKDMNIGQFTEANIRNIMLKVKELNEGAHEVAPSKLIAYFDEEDVRTIISEAVGIYESISDKDKVLSDCIKKINKDHSKEEEDRLRNEIRFAQNANDAKKTDDLMYRLNELIKSRKG